LADNIYYFSIHYILFRPPSNLSGAAALTEPRNQIGRFFQEPEVVADEDADVRDEAHTVLVRLNPF